MTTALAAALLALTVVQPAKPESNGPPLAVCWDTFSHAGPAIQSGAGGTLSANSPSSVIVSAILRAGGVMGSDVAPADRTVSQGWSAIDGGLAPGTPIAGGGLRIGSEADLPPGWRELDAAKKERAGAALTIDLNELRAKAGTLFDAPWLQRALDRFALSNARLVSLRATLLPPSSDDLPPMLSVKALASARSRAPAPASAVTLIAPGWVGTSTDAAAVRGAHWAAALRFDAGGLGVIGRDGGVGTLAGLVRIAVDAVGTAENTDTAAWDKAYEKWQERASEPLRSLSTRLQARGTLACFGTAAAPELILAIPSRRGERSETLTKAMDQLAAAGGMISAKGVWTLKEPGPATPAIAVTVCDTPSGPWLLVSVEHGDERRVLLDAAARMKAVR
ncbi:MAG TPA: hypothetical protein VFF65_00540 [Phycisphaerales bacterium]|nr:hypothetical protein [Phycisphaerales bacterium]